MANTKKIATSVAAVATAAALLLGGTFAWQSISQTALNEASDVVNPGGRLHNDMWYETAETTNSDVYVENFAEDEIYARVRLSEYMEIVMNYGVEGAEKVETLAGEKLLDGTEVTDKPADNTSGYTYKYTTHYFHDVDGDPDTDSNLTDKYWDWTTGSEDSETVYYMPTFNLNKDSFAPDLNGLYRDRVGGISNREMEQYTDMDGNALTDYTGYAADSNPKTAYAIYDADTNDADEIGVDPLVLAGIINNGTGADEDAVKLVQEEHSVAQVGETKGLVSLSWWLGQVNYDETTGEATNLDELSNYWVYDDTADVDGDGTPDGDGWVYWSSPIGEDETTGLLLDSFTLKDVMDDTWYYAIEVTGQFITADDLGEPAAATYDLRNSEVGGTGFYRDGETVSDNALTLLALIGVDVNGDEEGGEIAGSYTISFGDEKAIIGSTDTTGIAVSLLGEDDSAVTEGVTWTVSGGKAEVVDGSVKASDTATMTAVLEKLTLSASVDGAEVASADLYMYDTTAHVMSIRTSNIITATSGVTYCLFDSAVSMYPVMSDATTGCIWKFGDSVDNIYLYTDNGTAAVTDTGRIDRIEAVVYNGATDDNYSYDGVCPHMSEYSEEVPYTVTVTASKTQYAPGITSDIALTAVVTDGDGQAVTVNSGEIVYSMSSASGSFTDQHLTDNSDSTATLHLAAAHNEAVTVTATYLETFSGSVTIEPSLEKYVWKMSTDNGVTNASTTRYPSPNLRTFEGLLVYDAEGNDITNAVTVSLTGNNKNETTLTAVTDENGAVTSYTLTIGAEETAETITMNAWNEAGESVHDVYLNYRGILMAGSLDVETGYEKDAVLYSSNTKTMTYALGYKDYWGNVDDSVTFGMTRLDANIDETNIEDGVLTLGIGESGNVQVDLYDGNGEKITYYLLTAEVDGSAPTIGAMRYGVTNNNVTYTHAFSLTGINTADYGTNINDSMTVKVYKLTADTTDSEAYTEDCRYVTFKVKTDREGTSGWFNVSSGVTAAVTKGVGSTGMTTLTLYFNYESTEDDTTTYLGIVVTDRSGNTVYAAYPVVKS